MKGLIDFVWLRLGCWLGGYGALFEKGQLYIIGIGFKGEAKWGSREKERERTRERGERGGDTQEEKEKQKTTKNGRRKVINR